MSAALTVTTILVTELALTRAVRWSWAGWVGSGGVGLCSHATTTVAAATPVSRRRICPVMVTPSQLSSRSKTPLDAASSSLGVQGILT
ncbi:MAG TPA: hypothetical protein VIW26_06630 [Gemmatimonadales bacterium]